MMRWVRLGLKWMAAILLGLSGLFFLIFFVGETIGSEPGGWIHLLPAVLLLGCIPLGWKQPSWGGIVLLILGILMGFRLYLLVLRPGLHIPPFQLNLGLPFLVSGLLLLIASALKGPAPASQTVN